MSRDYPLDEILLPMGATTVKDEVKMEDIWNSNEYVAEPKWDGSRYLSIGGRFFSRRISVVDKLPVEKTDNVPHLSDALSKHPLLILDGEIYLEGSKSNDVVSIMGANRDKALWRQGFGEYVPPVSQGSKGKWRLDDTEDWVTVPKKEVAELEVKSQVPVSYVIYDILRDTDGNWLLDLPWSDRRSILEEQLEIVLESTPHAEVYICLSDYVTENKKEFYEDIIRRGGEGVMLKHVDGIYTPDKKPRWNWIKVKQEITSDVIITGFKDPVREYTGTELDTWVYWENQNGTPFLRPVDMDDTELMLQMGFKPITKFAFMGWIGAVEFAQYNDKGELKQVGFCSGLTEEMRQDMTENPDKYLGECMEISAMERTKDGYFRHPAFLRMRPDKNPKDCVIGVD